MVTPQLKQLFEEQNIKVIPLEVGAAMLSEELTQIKQEASQKASSLFHLEVSFSFASSRFPSPSSPTHSGDGAT